MSSIIHVLCRFATFRSLLAIALLAGAPVGAYATCPGQVPSADTMGLDCNAQQQQQQQQEEQRRYEEQQRQQQQADQEYYDAQQQQQSSVAQGQQVRQAWESRPPLPPSRNPLLGRWNSLGAPGSAPPGPGSQDDFLSLADALVGGLVAGLCDSMLGQGVVEFRPTSVAAVGPDGSTRLLYNASYRGGGSRVVVLPQDSPDFTHMIIDFDQPGHGVVAGAGCVVTRAGSSGAGAAATTVSTAGRPVSSDSSGGAGSAVLEITAGATEHGLFYPFPDRKIWVMKGSADMALLDAGFTQTPYGSIMGNFMVACRQKTPQCQRGLSAIEARTASSVRTDVGGHARTTSLPPGRYYVFATFDFGDKPMTWQEPIDLRPGSNSLTLDLDNAYAVE